MQSSGLVDLPDVYGSALVYLSFEVLYTLFVELGLDKGLVWIILSSESLILPVLTCIIVLKDCGNTFFVVGWWIGPIDLAILVDTNNPPDHIYCSKIFWFQWKSEKYIYIYRNSLWILEIFFFFDLLYLRGYINIPTMFVSSFYMLRCKCASLEKHQK